MAHRIPCFVTLALTLLFASARSARADKEAKTQAIPTVRLSVHPKGEPEYALQYVFETPYMEQDPGNGALLYERALSLVTKTMSEQPDIDEQALRRWQNSPLDELPLNEVRKVVSAFAPAVHCLDLAGRRESCTWEYPVRQEGFRTQWPALGGFRLLSRVLRLKARLQVADGEIEDAVHTLRIGMSTARDLGTGPLVVQNLVGVAVAAMMCQEAARIIEDPRAPNLYWALTSLPRPLIDMRRSMQAEATALYAELPELKRLERDVLSNDEVIQVWNKAAALFSPLQNRTEQWSWKVQTTANAMSAYLRAKTHLLRRGRSLEEIEALPALHVVLLYEYQQYRRLCDETFKWSTLPYWQAKDGLREASMLRVTDYHDQSPLDLTANPFAYLLPAVERIHFLSARLGRDIAMLRCVEAIRIYAAAHDGKLPKSLAEIGEVPVPPDPLNGRPFSYRVTADEAVLESPSPPEGGPRDGLRYEITIKQATR